MGTRWIAAALVTSLWTGLAQAQQVDDDRERRFGELDRMIRSREGNAGRVLDTSHRHLGFYLRADLGLGYMSIKESTAAGDLKITGAAGFFGIHVGGALSENVILGLHVFDGALRNPKVELAGRSGTANDTTATMVAYGPELTAYFMPQNLYLSMSVGISRVRADSNGSSGDSANGLGAQLALGREWWVSEHWGLGLVGHVTGASNPDKGNGAPALTTLGFGLAFSATYN
jgi:hypothetical protein